MTGTRVAIAFVALTSIFIGPAKADFNSSEIWFLSLNAANRTNIQRELVLTGHLDAIINGSFGPLTFAAMQAFQKSLDEPATGILPADELDELSAAASSTYDAFGLQIVQDVAAGLEIPVPTKILTSRTQTRNGTRYSSVASDFELQTSRSTASGPDAFQKLFKADSVSTAVHTVSYSHFGPSGFTVTGTSNGKSFYDRFYPASGAVVGFSLRWDPRAGDAGTELAAYLASYSGPIGDTLLAQAVPAAQQSSPETPSVEAPPQTASIASGVALQAIGGTYIVPVVVNNAITLNFTLDSGAADVSVPADVVLTLMRANTISDSDFTGSQTYTTADGSSMPAQTFRIRSLRVGDKTLTNVDADVAPVSGGLLLGQSFLSRFSSWSMDNSRHVLVLGDVLSSSSPVQTSYDGSVPTKGPVAASIPSNSGPGDESPQIADIPPPASPSPAIETSSRLALYAGVDFYGNDIFKGRVTDAVHCAAACIGNSDCKAFTFNANPTIHSGPNCFLKNDVNRIEAYSTAIGGLFLQSSQQAPQYNFDAIDPTKDLLLSRDLPGGDLSTSPFAPARTLDSCREACVENGFCRAFSYVTSLHQCWLKGSTIAARPARGIVSGAKRHMSIAAEDVINVPR